MARPTSVILMICDGLGFEGWCAADRHERGTPGRQVYQRSRPGAEMVLLGKAQTAVTATGDRHPDHPQDRYPHADPTEGAIDSAAAATALLSGRWVPNGHLNVTGEGARCCTLAEDALARGLGAGVVTSVQAAHATPAAVAAHVEDRERHEEIFRQLLDSGLDVIMGCGHPDHDESGRVRAEPDYSWVGGSATWEALEGGRLGIELLQDRSAFQSAGRAAPTRERLVGIARNGATLQGRRRDLPSDLSQPSGMAFDPDVPTLAEMACAALQGLARHPGFFLLVEGGAVDWCNHDNNLPRMHEEQMAFNRAVEAVVDWVERHRSWDDTLLVVTADHETGGIRADDAPAEPGGVVGAPAYTTDGHTTDLVPLWAFGAGSARLRAVTRFDAHAHARWGLDYGWNGHYLDATQVHATLRSALLNEADDLQSAIDR